MRTLAAYALLAPLLLSALVGCDLVAAPTLHDVYLYDGGAGGATRYTYAFGEGGAVVTLDDVAVELTEPDTAPTGELAVRTGLLLDGDPFLRASAAPLPEAPVSVRRIPLTTDLQLSTRAPVDDVLYYDGSLWFTLVEVAPAGLETRVVPRPRVGALRGLGALTSAEADALAAYFEARGPIVVALLREETLPERTVDGLSEYRRIGLYLQEGLPTDAAAYDPPAERLIWEVIERGSGAVGVDAPRFVLVRDEDDLRTVWNLAFGSQLTVPPLPDVNFEREAVLAAFLGTKPSGGYDVAVDTVTLDGRDLFVDLTVTEPQAGAITTQALTSPWLMLRVLREGVDVAWFRDADAGQLLGVARRTR